MDVAAYNSQSYYVQGDVATPGKLPWTGNETVLDALNYGGGMLPTAEPKDIRLVRPARAGKPAKVYQIDYEAILEQGDARANLQIFPGDRLVIGRNAVVKKTMALDRLAAPYQTVVNSMLQYSFMRRSLDAATPQLNPAQREAVLNDWVDYWSRAVARPEGVAVDEAFFREALQRALQPPDAKAPRPNKNKKKSK